MYGLMKINFIYAVKHILYFGNQKNIIHQQQEHTKKEKAHPLKFGIFFKFLFL